MLEVESRPRDQCTHCRAWSIFANASGLLTDLFRVEVPAGNLEKRMGNVFAGVEKNA
jgi:hypothetical protein